MGSAAPGRVCICTLGCAKNEVDSQKMAARLSDAGHALVDEPERADVVVVNTCSFIQQATEESIEAVLEAVGLPGVSAGETAVVVAGCMPARYGHDLAAELPEVAAFVPCSDEDSIVEAVERVMPTQRRPGSDASASAATPIAASPTFAYVKISDGCDRCCSYCAIPSIRGAYRSFPYEEIESDVAETVARGAREVVLIAQDTGRWGTDLPGGRDLAWLASTLADAYPGTLFRIMYLQPDGITDALLDAMASHANIASYLDIPLQHVDAEILRPMRRRGDRRAFEELVERIRERIPDVTLRTTLIAGFPGEDEARFEELLDFAGSGCFDYVGVFAFSPEEGTAAAKLPGQIPEEERMARAQAVREAADAASAGLIATRIGSRCPVLIEGAEDDGQLFGRTPGQAPEVDGVTYVDAGRVGEVVDALIEDTLLYDMEGTVLAHGS